MAEPAEQTALTPTAPAAVGPPRPATAIGLIPTTVDEAWRLATIMAKSGIVPAAYKGKPEDVLVAIMYGAELGLTPAQALTGISVINGRPGLFGEALLAVIVSSPLYVGHEEYYRVGAGLHVAELSSDDLRQPTTAAVCAFLRRGRAAAFTARFSIADAQRAHLIGKAGPWTEYPQIMLKMRARMFAARDAFPDLLRGVRAAEELVDIPAEASTPAAPAPVVRRISDALARELEPTPIPRPDAARALEPARVEAVAPFLDGALVHLSSGIRAVVEGLDDAAALGALVGTDTQVRLTVKRGPTDELVLESYAIQ
jgi:hypothetical protein